MFLGSAPLFGGPLVTPGFWAQASIPLLRLRYRQQLQVDITMGDADDCWAVDDAIRRLLALQQHATSLVCLVKAGQGGARG